MVELSIGDERVFGGGWDGTFYTKGIAARKQLSYHAMQFGAVKLEFLRATAERSTRFTVRRHF
jgi:hypothetical protein